jgi:hypothetical protein
MMMQNPFYSILILQLEILPGAEENKPEYLRRSKNLRVVIDSEYRRRLKNGMNRLWFFISNHRVERD